MYNKVIEPYMHEGVQMQCWIGFIGIAEGVKVMRSLHKI